MAQPIIKPFPAPLESINAVSANRKWMSQNIREYLESQLLRYLYYLGIDETKTALYFYKGKGMANASMIFGLNDGEIRCFEWVGSLKELVAVCYVKALLDASHDKRFILPANAVENAFRVLLTTNAVNRQRCLSLILQQQKKLGWFAGFKFQMQGANNG